MKRKHKRVKRRFAKSRNPRISRIPFFIMGILLLIGIPYFLIQSIFAQTTDTSAPQKSVVQPSAAIDPANVVTGLTTIEADVTDPSGVAKVEVRFRDQNDPINTRGTQYVFTDTEAPYSFPWDTTNLPDGRQRYDIQAWDTIGNGENEYLAAGLTAMNNPAYPPIQVITPIPDSTVSGIVTIEISTSADNGIAGVYFNGLTTGNTWTRPTAESPYRFQWDSKSVLDGPRTIRVRSFENDKFSPGDLGDPGETQFDLYVKNSVQTPTATPTTTPTKTPSATPTVAKTGIITGTILNKDGYPIQGAKISLTINKQKKTYYSDSQGKYVIPNVPPGTYTVTYVAAGYSQQKTTARVTAGQTLVINVTLHRR